MAGIGWISSWIRSSLSYLLTSRVTSRGVVRTVEDARPAGRKEKGEGDPGRGAQMKERVGRGKGKETNIKRHFGVCQPARRSDDMRSHSRAPSSLSLFPPPLFQPALSFTSACWLSSYFPLIAFLFSTKATHILFLSVCVPLYIYVFLLAFIFSPLSSPLFIPIPSHFLLSFLVIIAASR